MPTLSFGIWNGRNRTAYFVDEQKAGRVTAWAYQCGSWQSNGSHGSGGGLPCYISCDVTDSLLAAANYADGAISVLSLDRQTGQIQGLVDRRQKFGRGVDPERQNGPHAHCAVFDSHCRWLYHVDLGLDCVTRHGVHHGRLGDETVAFEAAPGSGPRHLVFCSDGKHALLICELTAELLLLEQTRSGFFCKHKVATAPETAHGNLGGHLALAPDGRIIVTNRGHDSLVVFEIHGERLRRCGWAKTRGRSPRHFHIRNEFVLIAHEESGSVTLVRIPEGDDDPSPALSSIAIPGAAFIIEIPWKERGDVSKWQFVGQADFNHRWCRRRGTRRDPENDERRRSGPFDRPRRNNPSEPC